MAAVLCTYGEQNEAVSRLDKYARLVVDMLEHTPRLHGDSYFDKLDSCFEDFELGSQLVRDKKLVIVDNMVRIMMPEKFEHEEKMKVLKILQDEVNIAGRREYVNNAIKIYCRSIFDALNDNDTSLIKFYKNEL